MRRYIGTLLISIVVALTPVVSFVSFAQNDLMDNIFWPSKQLDHVINIGNNKNAVGNEVFRGGTTFGFGDGFSSTAPLLVRVTQTLLRLTIALSVPVLIFVGVKLIRSAMNGGSIKEAFKEISSVLIGLALALSAVWIIYLIQSIAIRSLSWTI